MLPVNIAMAVVVAFPYGWCSNSVMYEMGVNLMTALPEGFVAGYMTLMNNLLVDMVYLVFYFFPNLGKFRDKCFFYFFFVRKPPPPLLSAVVVGTGTYSLAGADPREGLGAIAPTLSQVCVRKFVLYVRITRK